MNVLMSQILTVYAFTDTHTDTSKYNFIFSVLEEATRGTATLFLTCNNNAELVSEVIIMEHVGEVMLP